MPHELVVVTAKEVVPVRVAAFSSRGYSADSINPDDTSLHTAIRIDGEIMSVSTLTNDPSPRNDFTPVWRIRGMATLPSAQGRGFGGLLLDNNIRHIADNGGGLVWGNLRIDAIPFYERHGFVVTGDIFPSESGALHRYGEMFVDSSVTEPGAGA